VYGPQGMLETGMRCSGINKACKAKLFYTPQPLYIGMLKQIKNEGSGYDNKPVNRVVDNLPLVYDG
jgi:hypothetical protein